MSISPPSRKWKKPILPEGASLTFADYFKLNADTEEVLACFGYSYLLADCRLPHSDALDHDRLRDVTQLAIELVALDQWADDRTETRFYGAVSDGDVWRFGFLDREEKRITHDLNSYTVPKELVEVLQILVGILTD